jgi:hypothetical protein
VGSSARTSAGPCATAAQTATRCASPPDSVTGRRRARWPRPRLSRSSRARARAAARVAPPIRDCTATLSTMDSSGRSVRAWCWSTRPSRRARRAVRSRSRAPTRSTPHTSTAPALGARSPARTRNSVVLPEPFGPCTTTRSPAATSRVSPRRAATCPRGAGYRQKTSCARTVTAPPPDAGATAPAVRRKRPRRPHPGPAPPRRRGPPAACPARQPGSGAGRASRRPR